MTGLPWKTLFSQDKFWCSAPTVPSPLQRWQRSHTSLIPCSPKFPVVSAPTGVEFWPQQSLLVAVWKVQLDTKGITERFGLERNLKFIYFQPPAMDSFHYLPGCSDLHPTWPWRDRFSLDIEKFCSLILSKPSHRKKNPHILKICVLLTEFRMRFGWNLTRQHKTSVGSRAFFSWWSIRIPGFSSSPLAWFLTLPVTPGLRRKLDQRMIRV